MFLTYKVTECRDCRNANLLSSLDKAIGKLSSKIYRSVTLMEARKCDERKLKDLIHYKNMVLKVSMNPEYYKYKYQDIISKVKTLI